MQTTFLHLLLANFHYRTVRAIGNVTGVNYSKFKVESKYLMK